MGHFFLSFWSHREPDTTMTIAERKLYSFDQFVADPLRRVLLFDGQSVAIMPKALSMLLVLLERPGTVISKEELLERLWPDTSVSEASLSQAVFWLRKSLGEHAGDHRYVVTVPGQGFMFATEVQTVTPSGQAYVDPPAVEPHREPIGPVTSTLDPAIDLAPPHPAGRKRMMAASALIALILVVVTIWVVVALRPGSTPSQPSIATAATPRPIVAISSPKDLSESPNSAWLKTALAEMLTTEIAAGARVRVVADSSAAVLGQPSDAAPTATTVSTAGVHTALLHDSLGARTLVSGTYLMLANADPPRLRVDLRLITLPSGEVTATMSEEASQAELFSLVSRLGAKLRNALGVGDVSDEQIAAAHASQPANAEAARLYAEGLAALRRFDAVTARDRLTEATQADPSSALIHGALAQAWSALGYDNRAAEQAVKASELSTSLARPERLLIEARRWELSGDWRRASETYRSLWTFYPDDLEYGLSLAEVLTRGGRGQEALSVVVALRRLPAPLRDDPRVDMQEALAAQSLAQYERQTAAAEHAVDKARRSGATWIEAFALAVEAAGRRAQGQLQPALALLDRSRSMSEAAGDRAGVADALTQSGVIARELGELDRARTLYGQALATYREIGYWRAKAAVLGNLGVLELYQGELTAARGHLGEARTDYVELEDPVGEASVLAALGPLQGMLGDTRSAREMAASLLDIARRTGNRALEASGLRNVAIVALDLGALDEAMRHLEAAHRIAVELPMRGREAQIDGLIATVYMRRDALDDARTHVDEALTHARESGDRLMVGKILGVAQTIARAQNRLDQAQQYLDEQLAIARTTGAKVMLAEAMLAQGELQHARGNFDDATRSIGEALAWRERAGDVSNLAETRLALARVMLDRGDRPGARAEAQRAVEIARRLEQRHWVARAQSLMEDPAIAKK